VSQSAHGKKSNRRDRENNKCGKDRDDEVPSKVELESFVQHSFIKNKNQKFLNGIPTLQFALRFLRYHFHFAYC
jgi:hypothetical protein